MFVYHFHGQTGRSTVWANGTGKFRPGIAFTIATNKFHLPKKRPRRPEPGIKDGFEEMELEFPIGRFRPEKQDYLFRCSVAPGNFPMEQLKSRVLFTFQPDFPENFGKW